MKSSLNLNEIKDPVFHEIVNKLVAHFQPTKVLLFGSRAYGTPGPHSDYDIILIVKSSDKSQLERMNEANFVLWGREVPVDVFVYTEAEFEISKEQFNSISHTAATEGFQIDLD